MVIYKRALPASEIAQRFEQAMTTRHIRLEAVGGDITDHLYEFQYQQSGIASWITPPSSGIAACSYDLSYKYKPIFRGGQLRGNASTQMGVLGSYNDVFVYGMYVGGGVETVSAQDYATVTVENSASQGNNALQAKTQATINIINKNFINQIVRATDPGTTINILYGNRLSCLNHCDSNNPSYAGNSAEFNMIDSNWAGTTISMYSHTFKARQNNEMTPGFVVSGLAQVYLWWGNKMKNMKKRDSSQIWWVGYTGFDPADKWNTYTDGAQATNTFSGRILGADYTWVYFAGNSGSLGSVTVDRGVAQLLSNNLTNAAFNFSWYDAQGSFTATDNVLTGFDLGFKVCESGCPTTVARNTFYDMTTGFQTAGSGNTYDNVFEGCGIGGRAKWNTMNVHDNVFYNNTNGFKSQGNASVYNNTFRYNSIGYASKGSSANVYDNTFYNNTTSGAQKLGGTLTFTGNLLYSNGSGNAITAPGDRPDAGVRALACDATVTNNTFLDNNAIAIGFADQNSLQTVTISSNSITDNYLGGIGIGVYNGASALIDGNVTTTQWVTNSADVTLPHWVYFDLDDTTTVSQVKIYAGAEVLSWDVYISDDTQNWGAKVDTFSAGGGSGWYYSTNKLGNSGRYLKLQSNGGADNRINGDFFEIEYIESPIGTGITWESPSDGVVCSLPPNEGAIVIDNSVSTNIIRDNGRSGISFADATNVTIQNNFIVSNGTAGYEDSQGYPDASGIRAKNAVYVQNQITSNIIRYNTFSGFASYGSAGYIGPNNEITYNGDNVLGFICNDLKGGAGSGNGAVSVRNLDVADTLIVSGNVIENNILNTIARRDCNGTVRLDGALWSDCGQGSWDKSDAVVFIDDDGIYVNGVFRTASLILDCSDMLFSDLNSGISSGAAAWGVSVAAGVSGAAIRNCDINYNNTSCNTYGLGSANMGGGIFVGPGGEAQIYSNTIRYNGCEKPAYGNGGSAGIVMRCVDSNVIVSNNDIFNNKGDGIDVKGGQGTIGVSGAPNNIYNNGRHGVGMASNTTATLAYNNIYNNTDQGVGIQESAAPTVQFNTVYSHTAYRHSGIGVIDTASPYIYSNTLYNNETGIGFGTGSAERSNNLGDQTGLGATQVKLDGGANNNDDYYNGMILVLGESSLASPKEVLITDYIGTSYLATVSPSWDTNPSTGEAYTIYDMSYAGTTTIDKNYIYNSEWGGIGVWGTSNANINIVSNTLTGNSQAGIGMQFNNGGTITIRNNPNIFNHTRGIRLQNNTNTNFFILNNNYIGSSANGGISAEDNVGIDFTVNDNTIASNAHGGVNMRNNDGAGKLIFNRNSIRNNTTQAGIQIENAGTTTMLEEVTFYSNTIYNNANQAGIRMRNIHINGVYTALSNVITSNGHLGIGFENSTAANGVIVSNNNLSDNTAGGIGIRNPNAQSNGISFIRGTNNVITSNGNVHGAFMVESIPGLTYVRVYSNRINNNANGGVLMRYNAITDNLIISANTITNNTDWGIALDSNNVDTINSLRVQNNTLTANRGALAFRSNPITSINISYNTMNSNISSGAIAADNNTALADVLIHSNIMRYNTSRMIKYRNNYGAKLTVSNNIISSMQGTSEGILLMQDNTIPSFYFINNIITSNNCTKGAISTQTNVFTDLLIDNNDFRKNGQLPFVSDDDFNNLTFVNNTIASHTESGLKIDGSRINITNTLLVSNNTFRFNGGSDSSDQPGGISIKNFNDALTIAHNIIHSNTATSVTTGAPGGIGIDDYYGTALNIYDNTVRFNTGAGLGVGGIGISDNSGATPGTITIYENNIYSNIGSGGGAGGVGLRENAGTFILERNKIYNNTGASPGGEGVGVNLYQTDTGDAPVIRNNIVYKNNPYGIKINQTGSSGVYIYHNTVAFNTNYGIDSYDSSTPATAVVTNNIVWSNGIDLSASIGGTPFAVTYCDVEDGAIGTGNISDDPLFSNAAADDYHILSSSPCVDAGTDVGITNDYDLDTRPSNWGYDMGADEVVITK